MEKLKKKHLFIFVAFLLLIVTLFVGYRINEQRKEDARMTEEQRETEEAYRWIHYAIGRLDHGRLSGWYLTPPEILEEMSVYRSLESFRTQPNDHGIFTNIYMILRMYYHRGGVYLSYEMLIDYFSEEFELDGSLRLYNNGNHPEVEAFVIWMREELRATRHGGEFEIYFEKLDNIMRSYSPEDMERWLRIPLINQMSPQMLDALARAEADPDYILDLTSLREQGY